MKSEPEKRLDAALKSLYPSDRITEQFTVKIKGRTLFVDRVIQSAKLAFEIDGRQHREFVEWMHGDADGFKSSRERDAAKEQWLRTSGFTLVRLQDTDNLTPSFLRKKILEALNEDN